MDNQQQAGLNITEVGQGFQYLAYGFAILMILVVVLTAKGPSGR